MNRVPSSLHTAVGNDSDSMFSANEPLSAAIALTRGRHVVRRSPESVAPGLKEADERNDKKKKKKKKKKESTAQSLPSQNKRSSKMLRSASRNRRVGRGRPGGPPESVRLQSLRTTCSEQQLENSVHSSSTDSTPDNLPNHSELQRLGRQDSFQLKKCVSVPRGLTESMHSTVTQDSLVVEKRRRDRSAPQCMDSFCSNATKASLLVQIKRQHKSMPHSLRESTLSSETQDSLLVEQRRKERSLPQNLTESIYSNTTQDSLLLERKRRTRSVPRGLKESIHSTATQDSLIVEKERRGRLAQGSVHAMHSAGNQDSVLLDMQPRARSMPRGLTESMHSTATQDSLIIEIKRRSKMAPQVTNSIRSNEAKASSPVLMKKKNRSMPHSLRESMLSTEPQDSVIIQNKRRGKLVSKRLTRSIHSTAAQDSIHLENQRRGRSIPRSLTESIHSNATQDLALLEKRRGRSAPRGISESMQSKAAQDSIIVEKKSRVPAWGRSKSPNRGYVRSEYTGRYEGSRRFNLTAETSTNKMQASAPNETTQFETATSRKGAHRTDSPKPPKRTSKVAKSRSLPRLLGAISSSDDSIDGNNMGRLVRSRAFRRPKKKSMSPSRSRSRSSGMQRKSKSEPQRLSHDDNIFTSDDDSLAEIKAFFHEVKQAHSESVTASSQASEIRKQGYQLSALNSLQSLPTSRSKSFSKKLPLSSIQATSSDESTWEGIEDMLLQDPMPDFRRARTVSLAKRSPVTTKTMKGRSKSFDANNTMGWEKLARRSHENSPKPLRPTKSTRGMKLKSAVAVGEIPVAPLPLYVDHEKARSQELEKPDLGKFFKRYQDDQQKYAAQNSSISSFPEKSMTGLETVHRSNETSQKSSSLRSYIPPMGPSVAVDDENSSSALSLYAEYVEPLATESDEQDEPTLAQYFSMNEEDQDVPAAQDISTTSVIPRNSMTELDAVPTSDQTISTSLSHQSSTSVKITSAVADQEPPNPPALYLDYTRPLSPEPEEPTLEKYLKMNEDESSNDDDVSMSANDLLMLLDESSELDIFGHTSDEDSREVEVSRAPGFLMKPKELLGFLEVSNKVDPPEKPFLLRHSNVKLEGSHPMTLAEMADILNHVATRHDNNDHIRWDVISRMAFRDLAPDDADLLRPCDYVGDDIESDVSSISMEGIDERPDLWNSGGSFSWNSDALCRSE